MSMSFIDMKNVTSYFFLYILFLTIVMSCFYIVLAHVNVDKVYGLSEAQLNEFSQNDILFYDPSCATSDSGTLCGNTAREKYWSAVSQYMDDPIHIAGVLGNMYTEGNYNPVAWQGYVGINPSGNFATSWDTLYNHSYNSNGDDNVVGVGSVGITWDLSVYLHYVDENAPDLLEKYFKDPVNYSFNYMYHEPDWEHNDTDGTYGDELLAKIGAAEFDRLVSLEVKYAMENQKPATVEEYINKDFASPRDAASWWATNYEVGADYLNPSISRLENAEKAYDDFKDFECSDVANSSSGSGDYSAVRSAKNANESVFNVEDNSEWSARWGDGDTESMTRLLNNYGDLAYQLGKAIDVPWVAVLVQMRYEDPNSVCGKNNFWGNGCDSSHATAGGSTIQGENLGEGFVQYGETLTNGLYDQAIGIKDPKEFLETIGPIWVQGDPNGAGYGSIEGMKRSVDALQEFIDSPEGQDIAKQFGNYNVNICSTSTGGNGDINATAIELAWPEHGHGPFNPKPSYAKALEEVGFSNWGDRCVETGTSCDVFVTTVMKYSGADKDYECCVVSTLENYMKAHPDKYIEVENELGSLQPGDIRISNGHVEMYVEINNEPYIASASNCDRTGEIGNFYDNSGEFRAYRFQK